MTDIADGVQPDEGQGAPAGDSPYADYLDRIPEEVRDQVEPVFKDWDANTTRRFQDAAEYRKNWEPYEQAGVNQVAPDELQQLIEFRRLLSEDPQRIKSWYETEYAPSAGLNTEPSQPQEEQPWVDPTVEQLVEQRLQAALAPYEQRIGQIDQWRQSQEQEAQNAQVAHDIEDEISQLKANNSDFDEGLVEKFIANHYTEDPRVAVQKAWADAQAIRNQITADALQAKVDAPPPAEAGGAAVSALDPAKSLTEAGEQALSMLRARNSM